MMKNIFLLLEFQSVKYFGETTEIERLKAHLNRNYLLLLLIVPYFALVF